MKVLCVLALCLGLVACQEKTGGSATALKTQSDSVSYSIGMNIGKSIMQDSLSINPEVLAAGIKDILSKKTAMLTDSQMQMTLNAFQQQMMAKQQEKMAKQQDSLAKAGEINKTEGAKFLAENKTKPGVVTLPSGLQYEVLKEGTGPMPKATDNVRVHYKGTLRDGSVFDSSIDRGEPASFNVSGVVPGWTEALKLMKVGSKWRVFIPAELGYGAQGAGEKIGPNEVLIFEMELLGIEK
jgi:FKBP-type peptidyl-prolyl cis-trans isomerase FklB